MPKSKIKVTKHTPKALVPVLLALLFMFVGVLLLLVVVSASTKTQDQRSQASDGGPGGLPYCPFQCRPSCGTGTAPVGGYSCQPSGYRCCQQVQVTPTGPINPTATPRINTPTPPRYPTATPRIATPTPPRYPTATPRPITPTPQVYCPYQCLSSCPAGTLAVGGFMCQPASLRCCR